jgi:hypothetical protein
MRSLRIPFFQLCLCLPALLLVHDSAVGRAGPRGLNGITTIYYYVYVEEPLGGEQCDIDFNSLNTALQFVANQSTKLKIVTESEHKRRAKELTEITDRIREKVFEKGWSVAAVNDDKYLAAKKAAREYRLMPRLSIVIDPIELAGGCAGTVDAKLSAYLDSQTDDQIVPTVVEIWSSSYKFKGPQQTFTNHAAWIAEDLMKKLVNDWTASQNLQ